jgi:hypothetical protein
MITSRSLEAESTLADLVPSLKAHARMCCRHAYQLYRPRFVTWTVLSHRVQSRDVLRRLAQYLTIAKDAREQPVGYQIRMDDYLGVEGHSARTRTPRKGVRESEYFHLSCPRLRRRGAAIGRQALVDAWLHSVSSSFHVVMYVRVHRRLRFM